MPKKLFKLERGSKVVLGIFAMIMAVFFGLFNLGVANLSKNIMFTIGITLGVIILIENGVLMWFKKSTYKTIDGRDLLGIISLLSAGMIIIGSVLHLAFISPAMPVALLTFFGNTSAVVSLAVVILALIHMII